MLSLQGFPEDVPSPVQADPTRHRLQAAIDNPSWLGQSDANTGGSIACFNETTLRIDLIYKASGPHPSAWPVTTPA